MKKLVSICFAVWFGGFVYAQQTATLNLGDTIPVFDAPLFTGELFKLDSTLSRPLVIVFWATWNEPSKQLVQELKQIYPVINPVKRGRMQQNIDVIDVSIDAKKVVYENAIKREALPWNIHLADFKGWESELIHTLKIQKIPSIIIVDENRKVLVLDPDIKQLRNVLSNIKINEQLSN